MIKNQDGNRWVKILSNADLPKDSIKERKKNNQYYVYSTIKEKIEWKVQNVFGLHAMYQQGLITHYYSIIKPENPLL